MTERENALHVIKRDGLAQWIPWGPDAIENIMPNDVVRERPPLGQSGYDWFGCYWHFDPGTMGYCPLVGQEPLKDITQWREVVKFPNLEEVDWSAAEAQAAQLDRENKLSLFFWESGCWERVHALTGFQPALEALYEEPESFCELMDAIADYKVECVKYIAKYYKPDIICNLDDFGHQDGPFFSNTMFREMILPYDKRVEDAIREAGIIDCHHSCGKVDVLMDDIIRELKPDLFLGGFYPSNDPVYLEENFGTQISFMGTLNDQYLNTPELTDEEILAEIRRGVDVQLPWKNMLFMSMAMDPARAAKIEQIFKEYRATLSIC